MSNTSSSQLADHAQEIQDEIIRYQHRCPSARALQVACVVAGGRRADRSVNRLRMDAPPDPVPRPAAAGGPCSSIDQNAPRTYARGRTGTSMDPGSASTARWRCTSTAKRPRGKGLRLTRRLGRLPARTPRPHRQRRPPASTNVWEGHPPDTARKDPPEGTSSELRKVPAELLVANGPRRGYVRDIATRGESTPDGFERTVAQRRFAAALTLWAAGGDPLADLPRPGIPSGRPNGAPY
jgi:hypothetical protein